MRLDWLTAPFTGKSGHRHGVLILVSAFLWVGLVAMIGRDGQESIASTLTRPFQAFLDPIPVETEAPAAPRSGFRLSTWSNGNTDVFLPELAESRYFPSFLDLLNQNIVRQGVDDNFTVRVYDTRRDTVLEVFELDSTRALFERRDSTNWEAVDDQRRRVTRILVDKYEKAGIPEDAITVRWGRTNQVRAAVERNEPYLMYELRLADWLDLSLLSSQIGMVETFNQPHLVSAAGARSQYQIVPYLLRKFDINRYELGTASGAEVEVQEALHPLLTMEPALYLVRAYSNAVGHEVPGLSAYHTGPGNIFNLYRQFLVDHGGEAFESAQSVVDAYLWGLTDGFDRVRRRTSFGYYSRGYVPSAYGSLQTVDDWAIDTSRTVETDRVQLEEGRSIRLSELLSLLTDSPERIATAESGGSGGGTLDAEVRRRRVESRTQAYEQFRRLNPHIDLPESRGTGVPAGADLILRDEVRGEAVRFFLPSGAAERLKHVQPDLVDEETVREFDASTYRSGRYERTVTEWDRAYRELVENVRRFGFTREQRETLETIVEQFESLAEADPTPYRKRQLEVARIHLQMWQSRPWRRLAEVVSARKGTYIASPQPLDLPESETPITLRESRSSGE